MLIDLPKIQRQFPLERIAALTPERAYLLPHHSLREYISHYTVFSPNPAITCKQLTVVPDASGSIVCCFAQNGLSLLLWGPSSQSVVVERNPEEVPLYIMVEFKAGGLGRILNLPVSLLLNKIENLSLVDPTLANEIHDHVKKNVATSLFTTLHHFIAALDSIFLQRIGYPQESFLVSQYIFRELGQSKGTKRVSVLARQSGYSERHLNRILAEHFGMNAKLLARIIRINAACNFLIMPSVSLTMLAHFLNYHDQSHFIHDFMAVCSTTPGKYLQNLSDFYNEEMKFGVMLPHK